MATLAEIVTRVERRVIDLPTSVAAESQTLVLEAHRELQELHNFKCQEAVTTRTTTAFNPSLGAINLPLFKDYRGLPWHVDDLGVSRRFASVVHSQEQVQAAFNVDPSRDIGMPVVLLHKAPTTPGDSIELNVWEVYPIPDGLAVTSNGEYSIRIPYWSYLATPTTSDWFTVNAAEYLIAKATAEAFLLNWDEQRYAAWLTKAGTIQGGVGPTGLLRRVITRDKQFKLSNVDTLVPYPDVFAPRLGF